MAWTLSMFLWRARETCKVQRWGDFWSRFLLVYSIQALKPRVLLVLRFQPDHSSRLREHAGKEYPNSGVRIREKQQESRKGELKTYGCRHGSWSPISVLMKCVAAMVSSWTSSFRTMDDQGTRGVLLQCALKSVVPSSGGSRELSQETSQQLVIPTGFLL